MFARRGLELFLSTSGAKENALTASHQRLNPVLIRGTQRGFPHKNIENTFWVIQSTCRSLEMHSKRCFKICICSVILLGELSLFEITRALVLPYFPQNYSKHLLWHPLPVVSFKIEEVPKTYSPGRGLIPSTHKDSSV